MDMTGMYESDAGLHRYNPKTAAPALKAAMVELAREAERPEGELDGMALGTAYDLACTLYGDSLPAYWKNWQSFNVALKKPPAEMGDL